MMYKFYTITFLCVHFVNNNDKNSYNVKHLYWS